MTFLAKSPSSLVESELRTLPPSPDAATVLTSGWYSSGIGFATVKHLVRVGAKVYMASRSESRALAAIEELYKEKVLPGRGSVEWLELDLSKPHSIHQSVQNFLGKEARLDILSEWLSIL